MSPCVTALRVGHARACLLDKRVMKSLLCLEASAQSRPRAAARPVGSPTRRAIYTSTIYIHKMWVRVATVARYLRKRPSVRQVVVVEPVLPAGHRHRALAFPAVLVTGVVEACRIMLVRDRR